MRRTLLLLFFFISILLASEGYRRKRVAIPDDLDDVVDDENDDAWEQWGLKKGGSRLDKNLPPPDFSKMDPSKIQELMKQHTGPSYGFVKLKFGVSRSKEDVQNIATKWSKMLKTGSIDVRFLVVDLKTFMFTMEEGQDLEELKEFILSQSDAYEVKICDQTYRRPGDPPLDQVIERLRREKHSSDKSYNNELYKFLVITNNSLEFRVRQSHERSTRNLVDHEHFGRGSSNFQSTWLSLAGGDNCSHDYVDPNLMEGNKQLASLDHHEDFGKMWRSGLQIPLSKNNKWTEEEDVMLIRAHTQFGNQWAKIAQVLPGRTENGVKNHWNTNKRKNFAKSFINNRQSKPIYRRIAAVHWQPASGSQMEQTQKCQATVSEILTR